MPLRILSEQEHKESYDRRFATLALKPGTFFDVSRTISALPLQARICIFVVVSKISDTELQVIELSSDENTAALISGKAPSTSTYTYNHKDCMNIISTPTNSTSTNSTSSAKHSTTKDSDEISSEDTDASDAAYGDDEGGEPIDWYLYGGANQIRQRAEAWLAECKATKKTVLKREAVWCLLFYDILPNSHKEVVELSHEFGKQISLQKKIPNDGDGKCKLFKVFH